MISGLTSAVEAEKNRAEGVEAKLQEDLSYIADTIIPEMNTNTAKALDQKVDWDASKKVISLPVDGSISALRPGQEEEAQPEGGVLVAQRVYDEDVVTEIGTVKNKLTLNTIDGEVKVDTTGGESKHVAFKEVVENYTVNGHKISENPTLTKEDIGLGNVIDHVQPIRSIETINNEFTNLREVTQRENMNNSNSKLLVSRGCDMYSLDGKFIKSFNSRIDAEKYLKISNISRRIPVAINSKVLTVNNYLWCNKDDVDKIKEDIKYIYYKFDNNHNIISASSNLFGLFSDELKNIYNINSEVRRDQTVGILKKKYVNTGMPAPDGYYYQQGDPDNMIYDPNNTNYIKKREIIKWKSKKN